jgi:hypothetical protein
MNKCANCPEAATIEYPISAEHSILYCQKHIPGFLRRPEFARTTKSVENNPVIAEPAVEDSSSKKKAPKTSSEETTTTEPPAEAEGE